jgi:hypothetical protein
VRTKLWADDLSATVIVYFPGLRVLTFVPAFFTVIVIPGPVVPASLVTVVPAGAERGTASASTAMSGKKRFIRFSSFESMGDT